MRMPQKGSLSLRLMSGTSSSPFPNLRIYHAVDIATGRQMIGFRISASNWFGTAISAIRKVT